MAATTRSTGVKESARGHDSTDAAEQSAPHGDGQVVDRGPAYAVIGAGPHGLSALKALLQRGIPAEGFERAAEIGGNWNFGAETSRVYESTHLISSKPFTQFPDFPMPDSFPDYPSHRQVKEYFIAYARHFGLYDALHLDTAVVALEPDGDSWLLTAENNGTRTTYRYAGVVVANGHNWNPKMPDYPGLKDFTGEVIHSADYKGAEILRGKRVLVVGAGNTGCDVAVESAQNAVSTLHSTRRGYYYNPKYALGRPSDQVADTMLALRLPLGLRRLMFKSTLRLVVGDFEKFGLPKPDHEFFETHPIVNQQLIYYVGHGDIAPKPDVDHFDGQTVVFTDGTSAEVDLVVFCTGYLATFPFLDDKHLNFDGDHPVLARQIFTPHHQNLFVSGLIQPDSGQWTIAHWQGMTIAEFVATLREDPERASEFHDAVCAHLAERATGGTTYKESTRHYYEIAHQDYLAQLERSLAELQGAS